MRGSVCALVAICCRDPFEICRLSDCGGLSVYIKMGEALEAGTYVFSATLETGTTEWTCSVSGGTIATCEHDDSEVLAEDDAGVIVAFWNREPNGNDVWLRILEARGTRPQLRRGPDRLDIGVRRDGVTELDLKEALNLVSSACSGRSDPRMG